MTPFLSYLLKANLVLVLLYGFYYLCFRCDTFYGHIRWYLLATIMSAIAFPLVNISGWLAGSPAAMEVSQYVPDMNVVYQYILAQPQTTEYTIEPITVGRTIPFALIIWWCWLPVAIFMSGKRLFQLACIFCLWWRYPLQRYGNKTIIAVDRNIQPFSFSGRIFLNPSLYPENELDEILAHEQVHCRQGHTMDILLAEALVCLCWFNPAAWLLRRDLKQNLEYDTDRRTLQSGFDRKHYQYSLLRVSGSAFQIVNHFHFNHLKKRIIMMNKKKSPRIMAAKYLLVVPALAAALLTVQISGLQAKETSNVIDPTQVDVTGGVTIEELTTNISKGDVTQDSSAHPLYPNGYPTVVLDGEITPYEDINKVDPKDVDEIHVFKDGTYGAPVRNENGVVVNTTKRFSPYNPKKGLFIQNNHNEGMNSIDLATIEPIDVLKDDTPRFYSRNLNGVILVTTKRRTPYVPKKSIFMQNIPKQKGDSIISDYRTRQGSGYVSETKADAPTIQISGTVTHAGRSPIPGVAVIVKGANNGVVTDMNGKYSLKAPANANLQFSFVDMSTREIAVENRQVIDVVMNTDIQSIDKATIGRIDGNSPLYIVDGKEISIIGNISPESIESITILKDQSATSLYGEKARNGVIIITTKK